MSPAAQRPAPSAAQVVPSPAKSGLTRSRVLDWVGLFVLMAITARFAVRAGGPITDPDTWWHLRLGEEFRGDWSLGDPGQLSVFATRPWFATQWTLELLASFMEGAFGLEGVAWLAGAAVVALSVSVYVSCRQRGGILSAGVVTAVALLGTSLGHGPRPQLASFILIAVAMMAWLKTVEDGKPRWWLIPLSWLWACTHGMWFVGVAVGAVTVVGMAMDGRHDRRTLAILTSVPILSLVSAGLTPVGPKLLMAPFATSKMAQFVSEWQPPDFSSFVPGAAALMIAVVATTWARVGRTSWADLLLLAFAAAWVLLYARTVAVGAIIAAPLLAGVVDSWLPGRRPGSPKWERFVVFAAAGLTAAGLAVVVSHNPEAPLEKVGKVDAELERLADGTVVFNEYMLGGWLEWRHRNVVPVVDGMTDAYEVDYMADYMNAWRLKPQWYDFVKNTGAEYALLDTDSVLATAMMEREDWEVVVEESDVVLFRRIRE